MKKYKVILPPPSAKRMAGNGKVVITFSKGWGGDCIIIQRDGFDQDIHALELGLTEVEFEVPDDYEWIGSTKSMDGNTFSVRIEYTNSTGSRKEKQSLKPIKA